MEQANHVITMDQGCVWRQGPYAAPHSEKSPAQPTATLAAEQSPAVTTKSAHAVAESKQDEIKQKIDDLVQSHGDTSLYKYYFKSVGWKYSTIALSLAAGIQVLVIMRRMFQPRRDSTWRFILTRDDRNMAEMVDGVQLLQQPAS